MDIERAVLEILFRRIWFESVSLHTADGRNDYKGAKKSTFLQAARVHLPDSTEDENEQLYRWAKERLSGETKENRKDGTDGLLAGVFGMIAETAGEFLEVESGGFYYRHKNWTADSQFFHWKELAASLGQEPFMMSLLARASVAGHIKETDVSFGLCQLFPRVADRELGRLLGRDGGEGLTENHFHLKGSFPVFLLNWTCLMNHVGDGNDFFHRMKEYREEERLTVLSDQNRKNLFQASVAAAAYRLHLYEIYSHVPEAERLPFSYEKDPDEPELALLQIRIEYWRGQLKPYWDGEQTSYGLDYALADQWEKCRGQDEAAVAGERYFLYRCFCEIWKKDSCFRQEERNLFYKYLLISFRIRSELVQTNQMRGFGNFAAYQERKEDVIDYYPEYMPHIIRLTGCSLRKRQNLRAMEMRLTPKKSASETLDRIVDYQKEVERYAPREKWGDYFFVLHFPKQREEKWEECRPRNHGLRERMDRQIEEQKQLIRLEKSNYRHWNILPAVRGYDTCSGETGCRPEVFARFYRSIQAFTKTNQVDWIHWTYHVGEDFLDLVDGMRAIDEAVRFCMLPRGSRLGHGMALGLDAGHYYRMKQRKILLPGQDLMDNIAWTMGFCKEHGIVIPHVLCKKLEEKFAKLHDRIYGAFHFQPAWPEKTFPAAGRKLPFAAAQALRETAVTNLYGDTDGENWLPYYEAWQLRGDRPELYAGGESVFAAADGEMLREGAEEIRKKETCREYYRRYHFSRQVRENGEKPEQFSVDDTYICLIGRMQEELRYQLTEKEIGIECNPTSNYKIGPFSRFDQHPMLRMYGKNLEEGAASRMSISINTDDMGVFQTSLETEYAAMYVALRKSRDEQGRRKYPKEAVLRWLEDVKQSGYRQAFLI